MLARDRGDKGGTQGDLGLAKADVAANDAIHGPGARQIGDHGLDSLQLVRRFLEREGRSKLVIHQAVDFYRGAWTSLALGIDREQFGGNIANLLGSTALGSIPGFAAE